MDVCRTNKLFLMRQFGLSQSNFAVKKGAKCIARMIFFKLNILFLMMFIVYTKYFEIDIIFLLDKKFARHEQWFNIGFCEHMKYLLARFKNSKKWHQSVNTMCFWEANNNIRDSSSKAQWQCDNVDWAGWQNRKQRPKCI